MATNRYSVVLEPDEDGGFTVIVPSLPGVVTQGETVAEALENARDAIGLTLASESSPRGPSVKAELFTIQVTVA